MDVRGNARGEKNKDTAKGMDSYILLGIADRFVYARQNHLQDSRLVVCRGNRPEGGLVEHGLIDGALYGGVDDGAAVGEGEEVRVELFVELAGEKGDVGRRGHDE